MADLAALINNVVSALHLMPRLAPLNWWVVVAAFLVFITPAGRMGIAVLGADAAVRPGAGHLPARRSGASTGLVGGAAGRRQWRRESGRRTVAGVLRTRARQSDRQGRRPALRATGHRHAHSGPPVLHRTGGRSDRTLIDGDLFHVGPITVGNDTTVGARSTLFPGTTIGKGADIAPGSGVTGKVKNKQYWRGSPPSRPARPSHPGWRSARPGLCIGW